MCFGNFNQCISSDISCRASSFGLLATPSVEVRRKTYTKTFGAIVSVPRFGLNGSVVSCLVSQPTYAVGDKRLDYILGILLSVPRGSGLRSRSAMVISNPCILCLKLCRLVLSGSNNAFDAELLKRDSAGGYLSTLGKVLHGSCGRPAIRFGRNLRNVIYPTFTEHVN